MIERKWVDKEQMIEFLTASTEPVLPVKNEFRFHGTIEEFKKYMPELYEKMVKDENIPRNP